MNEKLVQLNNVNFFPKALIKMLILLIIFSVHPNLAAIPQSIAYDQLLNTSSVNCTGTLPISAVSYMVAYSATNPNVSQLV